MTLRPQSHKKKQKQHRNLLENNVLNIVFDWLWSFAGKFQLYMSVKTLLIMMRSKQIYFECFTDIVFVVTLPLPLWLSLSCVYSSVV